MSPKKIELFMIAGICAITLHFTIRFGVDYFHYLSLKNKSTAKVYQWEIVQVKDRFALKASYSFDAQNKTYQGLFTLSPPYYLNEMAALSALKAKAKESWSAWYRPKNPQISALEKSLPVSLLIRSMICYGVLIYFFYFYKRLVRV
jgi:hypothetical protein